MKPAQVKPLISPELLNQIDVRVGTILSVTDVANSDKLIALEVSFGDHKRTVLAGMKHSKSKFPNGEKIQMSTRLSSILTACDRRESHAQLVLLESILSEIERPRELTAVIGQLTGISEQLDAILVELRRPQPSLIQRIRLFFKGGN